MRLAFVLAAAAAAGSVAQAEPRSLNEPPPGGRAASTPSAGDRGMALMSATIGSNGALQRGEGAVSAARLDVGQYEIEFGRDVTACNHTATNTYQPATLLAQPRLGKPNWVYVASYHPDGFRIDSGFNLLVFCGR
ncbi:hypothetical protein ACFSCV_11650 [Methylopila henanensis]|uniref:Uncharacterized protein n=1 Tax=Methylopila henanensis TaxID=873516 RepID=A0ABW4K650_9HYPH